MNWPLPSLGGAEVRCIRQTRDWTLVHRAKYGHLVGVSQGWSAPQCLERDDFAVFVITLAAINQNRRIDTQSGITRQENFVKFS
jgi:hypothetical protein